MWYHFSYKKPFIVVLFSGAYKLDSFYRLIPTYKKKPPRNFLQKYTPRIAKLQLENLKDAKINLCIKTFKHSVVSLIRNILENIKWVAQIQDKRQQIEQKLKSLYFW